jgi:hypothetical protein
MLLESFVYKDTRRDNRDQCCCFKDFAPKPFKSSTIKTLNITCCSINNQYHYTLLPSLSIIDIIFIFNNKHNATANSLDQQSRSIILKLIFIIGKIFFYFYIVVLFINQVSYIFFLFYSVFYILNLFVF